jgi:tetratricopeptide (TPR) repeat protein
VSINYTLNVCANGSCRVHVPLVHGRPEQQLLNNISKMQDMMQNLQRSSVLDPHSRLSHVEIALLHHADEVMVQGTTIYEASLATESTGKRRSQPNTNSRVAKWVSSLDCIRQDQRQTHRFSKVPIMSMERVEPTAATNSDSEDDLDTDLVKAALDTGTKAFEVRQWEDANSLLNEALRLLQQLPTRQRMFCDVFDLHYKLAICSFHTHHPVEAEEALTSLVQQSANSDVQRAQIYDATHLLAQLYIRTGQVDRARSECEKALQARRRLLGKQSKAALESLALMAHIYVLQDNRALAKSCLSMIPEKQRDAIIAKVEASLGPSVEHLDFMSLLTPPLPRTSPRSEYEIPLGQERVVRQTAGPGIGQSTYSSNNMCPPTSPMLPIQRLASLDLSRPDMRYGPMAPSSYAPSIAESTNTERYAPIQTYTPDQPTPLRASESSQTPTSPSSHPQSQTLSRKAILEKVGCQPRDRIEEAVCASDLSTLTTLLAKKKGFWRSSLRKRVRPERVTALHFAALFGELEMARRLLDANFDVNVVPFGYTTSLTPLHFAIGARQVAMVDFLITNGARPSETDTWCSLASQLLSRSWLMKTMSEADRDSTPARILGIMEILQRNGWNINAPIDSTGKTILHQAVNFYTGRYKWDSEVRATVTEWLCERGADVLQANKEGQTPYDLAQAGEHLGIIVVLNRYVRVKEMNEGTMLPVELPGHKM